MHVTCIMKRIQKQNTNLHTLQGQTNKMTYSFTSFGFFFFEKWLIHKDVSKLVDMNEINVLN